MGTQNILTEVSKKVELLLEAYLDGERSWRMFKKIADEHKIITELQLENLFGAIQRSLLIQTIISIGNIFEKSSKKYPTACIDGILKTIETSNSLPKVTISKFCQFPEIYEQFENILYERSICAKHYLLEPLETVDIEEIINNYLPNSSEWDNLKFIRDKRIGHKEIINLNDSNTAIDIKTIDKFYKNGKIIIIILGMTYLNDFSFPSGLCKVNQDLNRLLVDLKKQSNK